MIKKLKDFNELKLENNNIGNYIYCLPINIGIVLH
jgi:hypothetical protein